MASLAGAITTLGLAGVSIAAPLWDSEYTTSPKPYTQTFTALSCNGTSGPYLTDFGGKSELTDVLLSVSDTAALSATEEPVDSQQVSTTDIARLSATETTSVHRAVGVTDTASIAANETVLLTISGVNPVAATDTASLSVSEAVAIAVTVSVTDSAQLSASDTASIATIGEALVVTDSAALSTTEIALVDAFVGVLPVTASDTALLSASDFAAVGERQQIARITFRLMKPSMRFELL